MESDSKKIFVIGLLAVIMLFNLSINSQVSGFDNFPTLNQDLTLPKLEISNVTLSDDLPEEGQNVTFSVIIVNHDNYSVGGLVLLATIQQIVLVNPHGQTEEEKPVTITNVTLPVIPANSVYVYTGYFIAKFGQYTFTTILTSTLVKIPLSNYVFTFEVLSPPVGDWKGLRIAYSWLFLTLISLFLVPSIIDIFYRKQAVRKIKE